MIPSPEQVHQLAALMPSRLSAAVYVAAGCGLRLGEVLGLEVDDIDFDRAELAVRRQLEMHQGAASLPGPVEDEGERAQERTPRGGGVCSARASARRPGSGGGGRRNRLAPADAAPRPIWCSGALTGSRSTPRPSPACGRRFDQGRAAAALGLPRPAALLRDAADPCRGKRQDRAARTRSLHADAHAPPVRARVAGRAGPHPPAARRALGVRETAATPAESRT